MSEKIDEILRRIAAGMQSGKSPDSDQELSNLTGDMIGDPNCPHCEGLGYLRQDHPVGHPEFGKIEICSCRYSQVRNHIHQRLYTFSNLKELSHLTFDNFQPRGRVGLRPLHADSLEQAYNHARQFAQNLDGWLLLQGKYGCGKTHLAASVANFAVSMGVSTLFITVPDLLDTLRFAYHDQDATFEERFEEIRRVPLLILDDFGTQNATAWAQEKLFQILNYRYINRLPSVVTTNLELSGIEDRIKSRLQDPELVTHVKITAPDYRRPTDEGEYSEMSSRASLYNRTFASFDLRREESLKVEDHKSLEKAFRAARGFAEDPRGWIVFTGPYGCGKTHLAAAIANYQDDLGRPYLFVSVPDLLDHLRATFSPNSNISYDNRFTEARTTPLLILDDLGTQAMTPWVREKLYQLFDHRYNNELPTVITTSSYKDETDPRLYSRMEDSRLCTIYAITVPAYHGVPADKRKRGRR